MRISALYRLALAVPMLLASVAVAQPAPAVPGIENAQPQAKLPAWMKRGLRISYYQGSATIPSTGQSLVPSANGGWVNSVTGQCYTLQNNPSCGGAGFTQLTVVAADEKSLAVESRMYALMDPANGRGMLTSLTAYVGTPDGLGEFWIPPAKLAAMAEVRQGGTTVLRSRYPLGGKEYNAIAMETRTDGACTRYTYDLDSGMLLVLSTSNVGSAVLTPNPNGTAGLAAGATTITSTILIDSRQLDLPWLNDGMPAMVQNGAQLNYGGTYAIVIPGCPVMPQQYAMSFAFNNVGPGWATAKMSSRLQSLGGAPPQESTADRAFSASTTLPAWINPRSVGGLENGKLLDEDRITKVRTTFGGVQGNVFVLVEEGPFDRIQCAYDLNTGVLVDIFHQQQNGVGQVQVHLQLQR